jgi:hypothetical protein
MTSRMELVFGVGSGCCKESLRHAKITVPIFVPTLGNTGHNFSSSQYQEEKGRNVALTLFGIGL